MNAPHPPSVIGVGIDTARYGHHVTFLRDDLQPAAQPMQVAEDRDGYERLAQMLERLARRHPQACLNVRIDAAGQYAVNLERFLRGQDLPVCVSVGEPQRNRNYARAHFPKGKSDPVESLALARYAIVERPAPTHRDHRGKARRTPGHIGRRRIRAVRLA